jgi:hypothetical protein
MMPPGLVKGFIMIELPPRGAAPDPIHIVGGLIGSGKTSFIQHQLDHEWSGEKLGLILCEEGAVKLDFSRTVEPRVKRLLSRHSRSMQAPRPAIGSA